MKNYSNRILFVSIFFVLNIATLAQLNNVKVRTSISLNGTWQFVVDPYDYYSGGRAAGISKNYRAQEKSERVEYGFSNANTLQVPGDWNTQKENLFYYEGSIWYKKEFPYSKNESYKIFLHFSAINYSAEVYLNGYLLGTHEGGFTPFIFDCTNQILSGQNVITVKVNNDRRQERVPSMDYDWWNFGGITRDVSIYECPQTYIADYRFDLSPKSKSEIEGWLQISGSTPKTKGIIIIDELGINKSFVTDSSGHVDFKIKARPMLWSCPNPKLYKVKIKTAEDSITDKIGFRTVEARGNKIYINGQETFLKGICLHEEALFTGGRITKVEQIKTLFDYAKELNCNFVRLAHYPHSEEALRLADEMGLMVWAEVPVWQNIDFTNPISAKNANKQLEEMIIRDKNRASIIMWSVSNETDFNKHGRMDFLKSMISMARKLDPSRLITSALHRLQVDKYTMRFEDPLGELIDVLAANEYIGWYQGTIDDFDKMKWETVYNKPHIISEFGAEAVYGFHADEQTIWSEEFQAAIYKKQLEMFDRIPFLSGTSPWILKDFRSPRRLNPDYQNNWNKKGLISNQGERKKSFYLMQDYYRNK